MADEFKQTADVISGRVELAADEVGAAFAAVAFNLDDGTTQTVFDCGGRFNSLHVIGKATTQNADVKVQVRNAASDDWVDLAAAATLTAGTAADVYEGIIRARYFQIAVKDTSTAGALCDISFCLR